MISPKLTQVSHCQFPPTSPNGPPHLELEPITIRPFLQQNFQELFGEAAIHCTATQAAHDVVSRCRGPSHIFG